MSEASDCVCVLVCVCVRVCLSACACGEGVPPRTGLFNPAQSNTACKASSSKSQSCNRSPNWHPTYERNINRQTKSYHSRGAERATPWNRVMARKHNNTSQQGKSKERARPSHEQEKGEEKGNHAYIRPCTHQEY